MKKSKLMAGALSLCLLAGCTGSVVADPDDLVFQTAGVSRDFELFTVDGQPVAAGEYLFWLISAVDTTKAYGGLSTDEAWTTQQEDGLTAADAVKADALETAKLYQVIRNKAQEYGVSLSEEDQAQIDQELSTLIEQAGGEAIFQERLDTMGISKEDFAALNQIYYLNQNLEEALSAAGELTITDADLADFVEQNGIYAAKHILISTRHMDTENRTYEEYTDEEKAQALEKAQDLRKQLSDAGDSQELFDQLMNQYSEDGRDAATGELYYPEGYTYIYSGTMVASFEEGALALKEGEISDPIQSDFGYHIILRIPVDMEQAKAECTESYKLSRMTRQWMDDAEVVTTAAYDELDPKAVYERLQEINQARAAAKASAQPAESESPAESGTPAPSESAQG